MNDKELIQKVIEGDETALNDLIDRYSELVLNTCYGFVRHHEDAEDIAQEVFVQFYSSIHKFRGEAKLSTWLYRIAMNSSIDFLRHQKGRKKREVADYRDELESIATPSPEEKLLEKERKTVIQKAVDSLPDKQRKAFVLSKYQELSNKEVAKIMKRSISSVESLLHRAKLKLQEKLMDYLDKNI
ncbi:RNA polymerase sigma factor [bacterium]|nr:RNA polymerase sigma factor [bacterium]